MSARKQGWKFLLAVNGGWSRKAHFFKDGQSLCGSHLAFSDEGLEDSNHKSPDNCKACSKKRDKLEETAKCVS